MAKGKLLAEGAHQYFADGSNVGHENWQVSQLGHGGIIITSRAEFTGEQARTWNLTYELDRAWSPVSLTIRLEHRGRTVTTNQRAANHNWTALVQTTGDVDPALREQNYELPFSPQSEVDFGSTLFNTVTLLRTRLPVGAARDLDVVFIQPDSLVPTADKQRYECLAQDKTQVPAGTFPSLKYRMTFPNDENSPASELWADHQGFVLLYRYGNREMRLVRYRRSERR